MKALVNVSDELFDEITELTKDHSEALVALYEDGIMYGYRKGAVFGVLAAGGLAALFGVGVLASRLGIHIYEKIRHKKEEP